MPTIDERVVAMSFENTVFEQKIAQTLASLHKLDTAIKTLGKAQGFTDIEKQAGKVTLQAPVSALDKLKSKIGDVGHGAAAGFGNISRAAGQMGLDGAHHAVDKLRQKFSFLSAGSTFTDIEKASHKVTLAGVSSAIDNVTGKFGFLENAASVAFGNITSQAVMKGGAFAKSFSMGPITQGFEEYGTNMKSIQTIMANTEGQQVSGLEATNKHLEELNLYADQTVYNFSEMAKNIGTFTAAGVDLPKATASIKGIANLAALSGSNSQQASTAMYQLSQSIAAGKVGLQDWNSVVNAGMGGAVFQKSLMRTAENLGAVEKGAVKIDKATGKATVNGESFRNSIMAKPGQESWLTSDVLTDTLQQLTGDMTKAELVAKGYSEEQAKAIMKQAETAKKAATEVKTLPEVWDVAREGIGSGWGKTFQLIFGDFMEAKTMFTDLSTFIGDWISKVSNARNELLAGWKLGGGRADLIEALKNAFEGLMSVITPIRDAFRKIFPPTTVKELLSMTERFREFTEGLKVSEDTAGRIRRTFAGVFAIFNVAKTIVAGFIGVIFDFVGALGNSSGGIFEFIADIGDYAVALNKAVTEGKGLTKFFGTLSSVVQKPAEVLKKVTDYIKNLFAPAGAGMGMQARIDEIGEFGRLLTPLERIINRVKDAWGFLVEKFEQTKGALEPWFTSFVGKLSSFADILTDAFKGMNFEQAMAALQTGLIGGILITLKKQLGGGGVLEGLTDMLGGLGDVLGGVTGNLAAMQKKVQAQTIFTIAAAMLVLAGAIKVISTINGEDLARSMGAIALGLGQLMGALKLMMLGMGKTGFLQLPFIAAGIIGLGVALLILVGAMKLMSTMSWEEIGKGLAGVGGALTVIGAAMKFMPIGPLLLARAAGLIAMGIALNAIALALKTFGSMKMEEIGKGLFALVEALGGIALGLSMMPPNMLATAAGLVVLGVALGVIGGAVKMMGQLDFITLLKGLGAMMAALMGIGYAMWLMPPHMAAMGAGLILVGIAMNAVGTALAIMGKIGIFNLIKGLVAMAGSLIILAVGLTLMAGTLPGALALMAAAAALAVLAPTLGLLGTMKWSTIFKGLGAIALVLGTIAIVGLIAAPALAALGIALIPLGLGFMLVAVAAKIFIGALSLLASEGQKGIAVFLTAMTGFVAILPTIIIQFVKGLLVIVDEMVKLAPKVVVALGKILETVIAFIDQNAVPLAMAFGKLIDGILLIIVENVPKIQAAGFQLLQGLLDGLNQDIGSITTKVAEIVVKFLAAMETKMPALVAQGVRTLRAFLKGISDHFPELAKTAGDMISKFAMAVAGLASRIVGIAGNMMLKFIGGVASFVPTLVRKAGEIILKFIEALGSQGTALIKRGVQVAGKLLLGIANGLAEMADIGFNAIIKFLNGIEKAIRDNSEDLMNAGLGIGDAIMDAMVMSFHKGGKAVRMALESVFKLMPGWAKKILGIKSPSRVFMGIGRFTMMGFAKGVEDNQNVVKGAAQKTTSGFVGFFRKALGIHSPSEVFREIGMNVNRGFKEGLEGSADQVLDAFKSLNESLINSIRDQRGQVAEGHKKIEELQQQHAEKLAEIARLRGEKKPDKEAIASALKEAADLEQQIRDETVAVEQNEKALTKTRDVRKTLTVSMKDEKKELVGLKKEYEGVTKDLEEAQRVLEDATRAREDARKQYTDQYTNKPDASSLVDKAIADAELTDLQRRENAKKAADEAEKRRRIDQVKLYKEALAEQIRATQAYQATLQKLRELGLDDETYKDLLSKGIEGQEFADQLLKTGKAGIDQLNAMNAELLAQATNLAKQASDNLYQAGVNAAQGIVDGLVTKKAELEKAMDVLADSIVNAIKRKLKIKSPSRILMEVGKFTAEGLAVGLSESSKSVVNAATGLAADAEGALVGSFGRILDAVSAEVDPNLTITPVLDLTQVQKDAKELGALTNVTPITAAASYGQASAINSEVSAAQQAASEAAASAPTVMFEQNNYSPESLSAIDIYRGTKNQLGQLKSALGVPA